MCQKKLVTKRSIFLGFLLISKMAKMAKSPKCDEVEEKVIIHVFVYSDHVNYGSLSFILCIKSSLLERFLQKWKVSLYLVRSSRNDLSPHYLELRSTIIKYNFPLCALIYSISQNPSGHSRLWNFPRLISGVEACSNLKKTFDIYLQQSEKSELRTV